MRERVVFGVLLAAFWLLVGGAGASGGGANGALTQLASPDDCISSGTTLGCGRTGASGLRSGDWIATSPDGTSVYTASFSGNSIAEFSRDTSTGTLTELGCVALTGSSSCSTTTGGLNEASSVTVSPDGKNVYATGSRTGAVVEFARATDGSLTPLGCVQDSSNTGSECATSGPGLVNAYDVAVSPDGSSVYVAAGGSGNFLGAIAEFHRNTDGTLTQLASPNDCIEEQGNPTPVCGTHDGVGLLAVTALAVSPDGKNLYSVSDTIALADGDAPGAIAEFARDSSTGALTQLTGADACIGEPTTFAVTECQTRTAAGLTDLVNIAISSDGNDVYTSSDQQDGAITAFARGTNGALSPLGCIAGGGSRCATTATGLAASFGVAVSPDGANVYVAAAGNGTISAPGVVALARAGDGTLSGLAAPDDCIQQEGASGGTCGNTSGHGLSDPLGVAVSPDGANVYTVASGGAVAEFARGSAPPVNAAPSATFTASANGLALTVDGAASSDSDGTIVSYAWSFGDGTSGSGISATHSYATGGSYTVTLTVTDDDGAAASVSSDVDVLTPGATPTPPTNPAPPVSQPQSGQGNSIPVAVFSTSTNGDRVSFDASASHDQDGSITSYSWNFGDGVSGSGANPSHAYAAAGTFTVTLEVKDDEGATATSSQAVTVANEPPAPGPLGVSFAVTGTATVGQLLTFTAAVTSSNGAAITEVKWTFDDGSTAVGATVQHAFGDVGVFAGSYHVVAVRVTDALGASASAAQGIQVSASPNFRVAPGIALADGLSYVRVDFNFSGAQVPAVTTLQADGDGVAIANGFGETLSADRKTAVVSTYGSHDYLEFILTDRVSEVVHLLLTGPDGASYRADVLFVTQNDVNRLWSLTVSRTRAPADGAHEITVEARLRGADGSPLAGKSVQLDVSPGHAEVPWSGYAFTDVRGIATFTVTDTTNEQVSLRAIDVTDRLLLPLRTVTFVRALKASSAASSVAVSSSVAPVGTDGPAVTVTLRNKAGGFVRGEHVAVAVSGAAHVTPATATTDANGVATFTVVDANAETVRLRATDATSGLILRQRPSVRFVTNTADPAQSTTTSDVATVDADGTATARITVAIRDGLGRPVAAQRVQLHQDGDARIGRSLQMTDAGGDANFLVSDPNRETVDFFASVNGRLTLPEKATVQFRAPVPVRVNATTTRTELSGQPDVHILASYVVMDAAGVPVSGIAVQLVNTLSGSPWSLIAHADFDQANGSVTDAAGQVTLGFHLSQPLDCPEGPTDNTYSVVLESAYGELWRDDEILRGPCYGS